VKTCFKCGVEKPLREFYRHAAMADGHLGKCKACTKADVKTYWRENAEVLRQTDLMRRKLKRAAHVSASNAIRDGRLEKPAACHYCQTIAELSAHHWNYYRPLDVTWLCLRCHRIADMARRDAELKVQLEREQAS
jgi:hypothetical protein